VLIGSSVRTADPRVEFAGSNQNTHHGDTEDAEKKNLKIFLVFSVTSVSPW
jgi:hypothetical protein